MTQSNSVTLQKKKPELWKNQQNKQEEKGEKELAMVQRCAYIYGAAATILQCVKIIGTTLEWFYQASKSKTW